MKSSATLLPDLSHGVGMVVGGAMLALVLCGAVLIISVMAQKLTGRSNFLSRHMDASKMALPVAGALILGSASGAVAWSSAQFAPQKVAQPDRVDAAYKKIKPIETEEVLTGQNKEAAGKSEDNIEVAKRVLGSKFDELNAEYDLDGKKDNQKNFSKIEFVPSADNPDVSDQCHKIKVSYQAKVDNFDPKAPMVEHSEWVDPPSFDEQVCGGEAEKF